MRELILRGISRESWQAGFKLAECRQCGKCTASCPFSEFMDIMPRQILRYAQLSQLDAALAANTSWICAACHVCSCRCPQDIDIAALMEALRQEATRRGKIAVKEVDLFNRLFLKTVKMFGRSHEILLTGLFNILSGHFLQDVRYAPSLYFKGKIHLLPRRVQDRAAVRRLFTDAKLAKEKKRGGEA